MTGFSGLGKLTKHYRSNLFHGLIFSFFKFWPCVHTWQNPKWVAFCDFVSFFF